MKACVLILMVACGVLMAGSYNSKPTYSADIAPILNANCVSCHRPGQVAPFSLLTYSDAAKRATLLAEVTKGHYMPPWKPEPGFGEFKGERRLTPDQIRLISDWAKAGAPAGDLKAAPAPPVFATGWSQGKPDVTFAMQQPFDVPAESPDIYRCFVLPFQSEQAKYVKVMEFRAGNPRIVHHALVYLDNTGQARKLAAQSGGDSYPCFGGPGFVLAGSLGGWAPGAVPYPLGPGLARTIPPNTDIVIQIHYHPDGKPETDLSQIGLWYGEAPTKGFTPILVRSKQIDIPPGDADYRVHASLVLPEDVQIIGITPHAHYVCKETKVEATLPDGKVVPLIWIKDWDFNWQGQYEFAQPISLPKGTTVVLDFTYDNSSNNPRNPSNPPKRITWGEQTTDEMAIAFLSVVLPSPADVQPFRRALYFANAKH
jgi:hypothetical protein